MQHVTILVLLVLIHQLNVPHVIVHGIDTNQDLHVPAKIHFGIMEVHQYVLHAIIVANHVIQIPNVIHVKVHFKDILQVHLLTVYVEIDIMILIFKHVVHVIKLVSDVQGLILINVHIVMIWLLE